MEENKLKKLTNEELLKEAKKLKSSNIIDATLIGVLFGILIYSITASNFSYFFGAIYLFLLNSVFIAISTIVVLRLLSFNMVTFVNPRTQLKVKGIIWGAALLIIIPSVVII